MRCGLIGIVGRPNVGKSTLINRLIGQKVSITSRKPQTTRHAVLGVLTRGETQFIFVDTPGLHTGQNHRPLHRWMNREIQSALSGVHMVFWVLERGVFTELDP